MNPAEALNAAMRHHQAGQFAEAERLYAKVLGAEPRNLQALTLSGALAHMAGRNDQAVELFGRALAVNEQPDLHYNLALAQWALGQRVDAMTHWSRALALNPNFAPAHMNLGNALREDGRVSEAVSHLRRALQLQPSPFAHNNLGLALAALGDGEAAAHYQRAIAMHPNFIEPYLNLALEVARGGKIEDAIGLVRRSLQVQETADNKALFVRLVGALEAITDGGALHALVTRAAVEGWGPSASLAPTAATLLEYGSAIAPLIHRIAESPTTALSPVDLATAAREPLLRWLLEGEVICSLSLERFLTAMRATVLRVVETDPDALSGDALHFACALARQCFINEYVYAVSEDERMRATRLRDALGAKATTKATIKAGCVAAVAAYFPLHAVGGANALLPHAADGPLAALLDQQIRAPGVEARCRAAMPRLTAVNDDVSRLVQDQYEHNPYPRWIAPPQPSKCPSVDALIRHELPHAPFRALGKGADLDILIAGCGTGRQSISVARQFERAQVLAVDLSSASLGYAKARTDALGVSNIEYAQADILELGSIGRSFDIIQSDGVLHHLGDPWAGWRVLLGLLRPGGVMHVSLYSEIARRDVVAARAFIAQRRYGTTGEDIRACRAELMAQPDDTPLKRVAMFNDFFTTSECHDLLFHVQEHRMTLPKIKEFLGTSGMQFLGFDLDYRVIRAYAARFPTDRAMIDLDSWHAFEQDHPYTFASMYRFWIQKPA